MTLMGEPPADSADRDEWLARILATYGERQDLLGGKEQLVSELEALLFRHDPIRINYEDNSNEYRPEAESIALRLGACASEDDVLDAVYEEFVHWFSASVAGAKARYRAIAKEVWSLRGTYG